MVAGPESVRGIKKRLDRRSVERPYARPWKPSVQLIARAYEEPQIEHPRIVGAVIRGSQPFDLSKHRLHIGIAENDRPCSPIVGIAGKKRLFDAMMRSGAQVVDQGVCLKGWDVHRGTDLQALGSTATIRPRSVQRMNRPMHRRDSAIMDRGSLFPRRRCGKRGEQGNLQQGNQQGDRQTAHGRAALEDRPMAQGGNRREHRLVPKVGLEPTRGCPHWILNPARLPVPPLRPIDRYQRHSSPRSALHGPRISA